jgi:hypothetical protein
MTYPVGRALVRFEPVGRLELPDVPARYELVEVIHDRSGARVGWWVVDTVPESPAGTAYTVHGFFLEQADAELLAATLVDSDSRPEAT